VAIHLGLLSICFFFFGVTEVWTQVSSLLGRCSYYLSHSTNTPFGVWVLCKLLWWILYLEELKKNFPSVSADQRHLELALDMSQWQYLGMAPRRSTGLSRSGSLKTLPVTHLSSSTANLFIISESPKIATMAWKCPSKVHVFKAWEAVETSRGGAKWKKRSLRGVPLKGYWDPGSFLSLSALPSCHGWTGFSCHPFLNEGGCDRPKATGLSNHELKPTKLWAEINLSSLKVV
jgi:hypothetical protein